MTGNLFYGIIVIIDEKLTGGAGMLRPEQLPVTEGLPELMQFTDGGEVKTAEDWNRRREEQSDRGCDTAHGSLCVLR